jgi:hypothetical protein
MDARIKSGHDERVSQGEVEDRFTHTNFNFQTAKTISNTASRSRGLIRPRFAGNFLALPSEGAGNAGRPMRPQPRV